MKSKSNKFHFNLILLFVLCIGSILNAQTPENSPNLLPDQTIERELKGGETHRYRLNLTANRFLQFKVEQKGIDVVVRLLDSGGKLLAEMDSPNGTQGFEELVFIVADAGSYTIEVGSLEADAAKANYTIFLETPRTATEKDKKTLEAKAAFAQGNDLANQRTAESFQTAGEKFLAASVLYRQIGDKINEGQSLVLTGLMSFNLGEPQSALNYYNQALTIFESISDKYWLSVIYSNIGLVYSRIGERQKALEFYEKSLPFARDIGDKESEGTLLGNIGAVYYNLGEFQKALEYFNKSLALARAAGDKEGEARHLSNIGLVYSDLGEHQKALEYHLQSLPLRREIGDKEGIAATLNNIGTNYFLAGEKRKSLDYFLQTLPITRELGDKGREAVGLNNIGRVYNDLGESRKSLEYYEQSVPLFRAVGDKQGVASAYNNIMFAWASLGNRPLAVFYGKQSVSVFQQLRSNIKGLNKSIQQSYLKTIEKVYRNLADLLIAESRLTEAEAVLDLLKDEEFSGLAKRGSEAEDNVPYSKSETAALDVVERLAALGREKGELVEKNEKSSLSETEKQRFREINAEIEAAETEFGKSLEALAGEKVDGRNLDAVTQEARAFMGDLRELGGGAAALYTVIVGDSQTASANKIKTGWIILVTPEFRKAYPIDVKDLEKTVFDFRAALLNDQYDPRPIAQTLYTKLFLQKSANLKTTLAADLDEYFKNKKEKTLMWSLDGVLRYVPMAALYDGDSYLVEKYRHTIFTTASKGRLKDAPKTNWTALGLGVSGEREESGRTFPKLPGTKRELEEIIKEKTVEGDTGILTGTISLDEQFTAETMQDALAFDKNPVVHIASHFSFDRADFNESFLLLGKGKLTVGEMDKKLNLFSNVDLLTLSACDTAVGNANGKEIEGFAYIAQSLGAKAVLASLWQIADTGTDELMIRFYKLRKENPQMSKGEAFRQAQLAMLGGRDLMNNDSSTGNRSGVFSADGKKKLELPKFKKDVGKPFAHPHYWAAFVLIGNWR